jgi:SAM-dependent methyltransferase
VTPFKDYFSQQASDYAEFRPHYPVALFAYLASLAPARQVAWDCGTGSGQAALGLTGHFDRVIATDGSESQLRHAIRHPRIIHRRARAEASGLGVGSVDLITVAQALHWFDVPAFFAEAKRVLRPRGVLAVWGYDVVRVSPEIDRITDAYYYETLRGYWAPERRLVDDHYRSIPFPFEEIEPPSFAIELHWTRSQLLGYLRTWSATRAYVDRERRDPVLDVERALTPHWPRAEDERPVSWTLFLRVGRHID